MKTASADLYRDCHRFKRVSAFVRLLPALLALVLAYAGGLPLTVSAQGAGPRPASPASGAGTGSGLNRPSLEASANLKQQVESFATGAIRFEAGVTGEVRRGVERLTKSCQAPAPSGPLTLPLIQARDRIDQAQAAGQRALSESASRLASVQRDTAMAVAQQCSGSVLGFFKSSSCQAADNLEISVNMLGTALNRYRETFVERYRLYREVVELENRECVRPGFTDRLLQANESAMRSHEQSTPVRLDQLLDSAGQLADQLKR